MSRDNQIISGEYCGVPYQGIIRSSRVKFGGGVQHTVDLLTPIVIFGNIERTVILVPEQEKFTVTGEARSAHSEE